MKVICFLFVLGLSFSAKAEESEWHRTSMTWDDFADLNVCAVEMRAHVFLKIENAPLQSLEEIAIKLAHDPVVSSYGPFNVFYLQAPDPKVFYPILLEDAYFSISHLQGEPYLKHINIQDLQNSH